MFYCQMPAAAVVLFVLLFLPNPNFVQLAANLDVAAMAIPPSSFLFLLLPFFTSSRAPL
jgi:hypothetical protein